MVKIIYFYSESKFTKEIPKIESMQKIKYTGFIPPHFYKDNDGINYLVPDWLEVPDYINIDNWEDYVEWDNTSFTTKVVAEFESSTSKGLFYKVTKHGNNYICNCPGFRMAKSGKCKHLKSILQ